MKHFSKIPALACSLFLTLTQGSFAQSNSTNTGTSNNNPRTSVGNNTDMSGGTTNTTKKRDKTAKSARDCAANEDFVKEGDRTVCIPRTVSEDSPSTDSVQNQDTNRSDRSGSERNP